MQRSRAPFWAVDAIAMIIVGVLCFTNKVGVDTTLVVILAILGFGVSSRGQVPTSPNVERQQTLPDDSDDMPPPSASTPPALVRKRPKYLPPGGLATLALGFLHLFQRLTSATT